MKKHIIIVILIVLIIASFLVPYLSSESAQAYINNVSTMVSLCATLLTLVLAMILYNQIGLDQTLLQKKAEVVFELLELLNERAFTIETKTGFNVMVHLSSISRHKKSYKPYGHIKLLFDRNYIECIQPIIELENNVFLPKEIFPKILRLEVKGFHAETEKVHDTRYGCVVSRLISGMPIPHNLNSNIPAEKWGSALIIGEGKNLVTEITLEDFIERWDNLIENCVDWINRSTSYQKLNIPFYRNYYNPEK